LEDNELIMKWTGQEITNEKDMFYLDSLIDNNFYVQHIFLVQEKVQKI